MIKQEGGSPLRLAPSAVASLKSLFGGAVEPTRILESTLKKASLLDPHHRGTDPDAPGWANTVERVPYIVTWMVRVLKVDEVFLHECGNGLPVS